MGAPFPRPAALNARLETPIEEWPYLDEAVLLKTRSRKVCMTCHWFRHKKRRGELHPAAHLSVAPGADRPWRASHQPLPGLDRRHDPSAGLGAGSGMTAAASRRPPLTPKEGWLIHGRQVLRFRPTRWERTYQRLELISPDLAIDQDLRRRQSGRLSADGGGARR
jgi:hypothetical protein